jgi:hypothetical protein
MADHSSAVGGEAHIKFEAIAPVRQGQIEGLKGVLRDGAGCSRTAVTQE